MKNKNDESFLTSAGSAKEENLENKKNARFVEESNTGHAQNPAYKMPLSAKQSELVGGVRTSAAVKKQKEIEQSREKAAEKNPKHKVTTDKFAADPVRNLPPR